jgi:hypothetical protein
MAPNVPRHEVRNSVDEVAANKVSESEEEITMIMKNVAVIVTVVCALSSPAFSDDAEKSAVPRDIGRSISRGVQGSGENTLATPTTRAQQRSARVRARPTPVIVNSQSPIDLNLIGHN